MATIRDVAALAGVSVATVSRVLNDSGYADSATRARVLQAAAELEYQRNINWSRLKSNRSRTILFLLGNRQSANSMHMRVLEAGERTLRAHGYDLIFVRHEYSGLLPPAELPLPRVLETTGSVDGVLLAGVHYPNLLEVLDQRRLPYALMGNDFGIAGTRFPHHGIYYDDSGAIAEAVGHLVRLGHQRIAFVGNTAQLWFERRHQAYLRAVHQYQLAPLAVTENWQVDNHDYGQLALAQLLREPAVPTAVLAANDELAAGVWKELVKRQIAIPRQMSLLGVGDRAEYAVLEPALTSIRVFADQLGERLTNMLLRRLADPQIPVPSETYPCQLIARASCGPPPALRVIESLPRLRRQLGRP